MARGWTISSIADHLLQALSQRLAFFLGIFIGIAESGAQEKLAHLVVGVIRG